MPMRIDQGLSGRNGSLISARDIYVSIFCPTNARPTVQLLNLIGQYYHYGRSGSRQIHQLLVKPCVKIYNRQFPATCLEGAGDKGDKLNSVSYISAHLVRLILCKFGYPVQYANLQRNFDRWEVHRMC